MDTLTGSLESVAKKQKTTYTKSCEGIGSLVDKLKKAKQMLAISGDSQVVMSTLQASVREMGLVAQLSAQTKEMHGALSKLGKAMDKFFVSDISKVSREGVVFDESILNTEILHHLYRQGRFDLADTFMREAGVQIQKPGDKANEEAGGEPAKEPCETFRAMHEILAHMRQRDLGPALAWAEKHRDELAKCRRRPSPIEACNLEFHLHKLRFVDCLRTQGRVEALGYARAHLSKFASSHMREVQRLMGCLLWADRLESSPYADLLSEKHWSDATLGFMHDYCFVARQPFESPLCVCVTAGAVALPMLLKLASVMTGKSQDNWDTCKELPVEIDLGREFHFHSVFSCPVSRDQATPDNPPMLLPCGHVLCNSSVQRLAKGSARAFKCPYCPSETTTAQCKQIHL
eukprot:jgi/Mesvir1/20835/Mv07929-RA.1